MTRVMFQGTRGAYSEEAIRHFFGPEVEAVACDTLGQVFDGVENGDAGFGMVPVENTVAGSVVQSYELLMDHDVRIYSETVLHVRHVLLGAPGAELSDIKRVRSHKQALAQCQRYIERNGFTPEPSFDTAGSAQELSANPVKEVAAIASELCDELYGLQVLERGIEDFRLNYTRFFVISLETPPRAQRNKTSIAFVTPHQPGALYECLGEFATRGINLTKIESRPRINQPWQYIFHLDFEGHYQAPECEKAIMGLLRRPSFVKLLGSYPAAPQLAVERDMTVGGQAGDQEGVS